MYGGFPRGGGKWEDSNPVINPTVLSGDIKGDDNASMTAKELYSDASREDNVVHVVTASGTDEAAVLDGFVITGGNTQHAEKGCVTYDSLQGAGLYCKSGSPTISNCVFKFNSAEMGTVYFWRGNPKLMNCKFVDNYAADSGAGIYLSECNPTIINCVFSRNTAEEKGGAIYNEFNKAVFTNCTITKNYAYAGGGVYNQKSTPVLTNCILWANTSRYGSDEPAQVYGINVKAANCCIQGLTEQLGGQNCISRDPQISDLDTAGYHLSAGSPCIDTGDSKAVSEKIDADIDTNPRIAGKSIDMGAVEVQ
jgi:parallel beta-helix repeat protein